MTIAVPSSKTSEIRALAAENPKLTVYQIAGKMRLRGHAHVLASDVRAALGREPVRRIKSIAK